MPRTRGRARSSELAFRPYSTDGKPQLIGLLGRGRSAAYVRTKARIFEWQFARNPHDDGRDPFLVAELAPRTLVGLSAVMPARVRFQGERVVACWSCDTCVVPEYRGLGVDEALAVRASRAAPVVLGFGTRGPRDALLDELCWAAGRSVVQLVFHVAERGWLGAARNACSRVAALRGSGLRYRACRVSSGLDAQAWSEIDELWLRAAKGYVSAVERDAAYLRWKFCEHPAHEYLWYALRCRHHVDGILIARHDPQDSVIVDYCGPAGDIDLMSELAASAVEDLARRRTTRIRCETNHVPMIEALQRVGFTRSRSAAAFRVRANVAVTDPLAGWFLMTGDGDRDMLGRGLEAR